MSHQAVGDSYNDSPFVQDCLSWMDEGEFIEEPRSGFGLALMSL